MKLSIIANLMLPVAALIPAAVAEEPIFPGRDGLISLVQYSPLGGANPHAGIASVDEMVARLASRLEAKPNDPEGWRMLGWSYLHTNRPSDAVTAYAKAVELTPENAGYQASYAEALILASKGTVTPAAAAAIEHALAINPSETRARYLKGLSLDQAGDKTGAYAIWVTLLEHAGPNDDWAQDVRQRLSALSAELKISVNPRLLMEKEAENPGTAANTNGPSQADIEASKAMSEEDRRAMIRRMVDGLAERLAKSPQDADGWIKLMRSRMVLGEKPAAKEVLSLALLAFMGDEAEKARITAAAKDLHVSE